MSVWQCKDCHTVGFYYGMAPQEIQDRHMKECEANKEPETTPELPPTRWPEGAEL